MSGTGRLRILVVMNQMVRGYAGGDFHAVQVLNRWSERHHVEVLLPDAASEELVGLLAPGVRFRRPRATLVPTSPRRLLTSYFLRMAGSAWHVFRHRGDWDAVVASTHYPFDVVPLLLASRRASRFVYWHHHFVATSGRPAWLRLLLSAVESATMRILRRRRMTVFTVSSTTREHLLRHGVPSQQVVKTTNSSSLQGVSRGADPELVAALEGRRFALFCARISRLKGSDELRALIPELIRRLPERILVVAGDGPEAEQLRRFCADLGAGARVLFPGFVSEATKTWLFRHADAVLAPSYEEGWGITVCDALTSGCAVVSYALPAVVDAFPDGPTYVQLGDRQRFVTEALRVLAEGRPERRRPSTAIASWDRIAQAELETISDAVARRPGGAETRVFLLTSHPVAPPWNSGDKNMARALLLGGTGVSYRFLRESDDETVWPAEHRGFALPGRAAMWEGAIPTRREKLRVYAGLWTRYPASDIGHVLMTLDGGRVAETALLSVPWLHRRPFIVTCLSASYVPWRLLRRAAAVVTISERTRQILLENGLRAVTRIPPGVDLDLFRPRPEAQQQRALGLPPGRYILFAGHQDEGGGLEATLELVGAVRAHLREVRLLLALRSRPGQSPSELRATLQRELSRRGLEDAVTLLGYQAEMPAAIGAAAAVVFPARSMRSKMELPLVLLEALAAGRPIVTSALEPLPEISDGSGAAYVGRPDDPATLQHLLRLLGDDAFYAESSGRARALAEARYDVRQMTAAYRSLYADVLARRAAWQPSPDVVLP